MRSLTPLFLALMTGCAPLAEMIQNAGQPTAKTVSTTESTIEQAQLEAYNGPKARVGVSQFTDRTAKGGGGGYGVRWYSPQIGNGMADMLSDALLQSIVSSSWTDKPCATFFRNKILGLVVG